MEKNSVHILRLLISYIIFGSIGIFVKYIPLSSAAIAAIRGICGAVFIVLFIKVSKKKLSLVEIKSNIFLLFLSGLAIGFNWIFLFEAYKYTTIATATLCYYMAPVFVMIAAPLFLKERLTVKSTVCVLAAVLGMVFVSGKTAGTSDLRGIFFGLAAAVLYAVCIICNKRMGQISAETRAFVQLLTAGVTVLPYAFLTDGFREVSLDTTAIILIITVGIVHTGIAYVMNLGSVARVPAATVAVLSYTDPIVAIILEAIITMSVPSLNVIAGAVLILGAAAVSSIESKKSA